MDKEQFNGSCLCGSVTYELTGDAIRFYHCHCERCRKASGTGHASNLLVKEFKFKWKSGEELLTRYSVPEAERFYNLFCSKCGSGMPRDVPELAGVLIPAGSLDSDISIKPSARIFWDSRVDWSCSDDGIKTFPEYP